MSGQFTTGTGCTIKVVPPPLLDDERFALVLKMAEPSDFRQVWVLLTAAECARLRELL